MREINDYLNKNRKTDKTQATKFLMPLVYTSSGKKYPFYLRKGIDNCYLYSEDNVENIILVYEITDDNTDMDEKLREEDLFIDSIDIEGENMVGYIFKVPDQYREDVEMFKEGKYSRFSDELKQAILEFWDLNDESQKPNELEGVLYLNDTGRQFADHELEHRDDVAEGEYWRRPNLNTEYFHNHYTKA